MLKPLLTTILRRWSQIVNGFPIKSPLCFLFFTSVCTLPLSFSLKVDDACSSDSNCGVGLGCDTCNGSQGTCYRIMPVNPTLKVNGLPFNRYSFLTTHNSFARSQGLGSDIVSPTNQDDSVTDQLNNGVRGLMLDMYDFENDVWLCHSTGGKCYSFTAFQPAINVLNEIESFLKKNPGEIVTIFIEDYVTSNQGLTKVFNASGLSKYIFPLSQMPKNGEDWSSVTDMIKKNQRLVVFTSKASKEKSEGIPYEWKYVVENQYGNKGMMIGSCSNRGESSPLNNKKISLVLQNYFPDNPNATNACMDNSASLISMMNTCYGLDGNRWPNYIAVDFYKKGKVKGASEAVDVANGRMACGCGNIANCKINATFGECEAAPKARSPPQANRDAIPSAGTVQFFGAAAHSQRSPSHFVIALIIMLSTSSSVSLIF